MRQVVSGGSASRLQGRRFLGMRGIQQLDAIDSQGSIRRPGDIDMICAPVDRTASTTLVDLGDDHPAKCPLWERFGEQAR
jgi:hypothetical protein